MSKIWESLLAVVIAICLTLLTAAKASAQEVEPLLDAVVRISGTRGETPVRGSGFVVARSGDTATVVTASHVIEGVQFEVVFASSFDDRFPVDRADVLAMEIGDPNGLAVFRVRGSIRRPLRGRRIVSAEKYRPLCGRRTSEEKKFANLRGRRIVSIEKIETLLRRP